MPNDKISCFVITPLGDENSDARRHFSKVFKHIITECLKKTGYEARWTLDECNKPERITKEIISALAAAPLVIADLTNLNPNVFYELAVRHAVGKPVIQIMQKGTKLAFDVQEISTPTYDLQDPDSCLKCIEDIRKQIKIIQDGRYRSEVHQIIRTNAGMESEDVLRQDFAFVARSVDTLQEMLRTFDGRLPDQQLIQDYREEIGILKSLRESGVISPYRNRDIALREFSSAIDAESSEIMVVGSSLLGLLQKDAYRDLARKLEHKAKLNIRVKLLLTHPKVADLRAEQEGRKLEAIGQEIIKSLQILRNWELPPEIRLYLGTPTIFAIRTTREMLLNFYAYKAYAYESPCLIVHKDEALHYAYFYDDYDKAHFGAWDSSATESVTDYEGVLGSDGRADPKQLREQIDAKISQLQRNLSKYSERIVAVLKDEDPASAS
jgi:hypothetical protein